MIIFKPNPGVISLAILIFSLLFIPVNFAFAQSIESVELIAGSKAPYGTIEELTIDSDGNVEFYEYEVGDPDNGDLFSMTLTSEQMDELYNTITDSGFFSLNDLYDSGKVDGVGLSIYVKTDTQSNGVEAINEQLPALNAIVQKLNEFFSPNGFSIDMAP